MTINRYEIEGLLSFEPRVFEDPRGSFFESFNQKLFNEMVGRKVDFVQDNQSFSAINVLRGLHFQAPPYAQGKLVRVIKGKALDVAVDLRKDSPTYGQHQSVLLDTDKNTVFWVPEGFAHGFLVLEEGTIFSYKCTNFYHKESEGALMWNDPDLNIDWGVQNPELSEKDQIADAFKGFVSPF